MKYVMKNNRLDYRHCFTYILKKQKIKIKMPDSF